MTLETSGVLRLLEPLAREPGETADVLVERRTEAVLAWRDGVLAETHIEATGSLAARWQRGAREAIVGTFRTDEAGLRDAIRDLQTGLGRPAVPVKPERLDPTDDAAAELPLERWRKRLAALFARHAPRHRFRFRMADVRREVFPARGDASSHSRLWLSLDGTLTAASRRGDEIRAFTFHAPESDALADELRERLVRAAEPRDAPGACPDGEADAVLADGCAVMLFHEILAHALEAGATSPLSGLAGARVAVADLDVRDDASRLDLFGGYEADDEGTRPRTVKLLASGSLAGRLTNRALAARMGREPSNGHGRRAEPADSPLPRSANLIVSPGGTTREDMIRRLGTGVWIEDFDSGSVDLAGGSFRLRFPRARRVRRGRFADELGPGVLGGEILPVLGRIEGGLGREARAYRALGWCARGGQVVPVQGEAPDLLVRRVQIRGLS